MIHVSVVCDGLVRISNRLSPDKKSDFFVDSSQGPSIFNRGDNVVVAVGGRRVVSAPWNRFWVEGVAPSSLEDVLDRLAACFSCGRSPDGFDVLWGWVILPRYHMPSLSSGLPRDPRKRLCYLFYMAPPGYPRQEQFPVGSFLNPASSSGQVVGRALQTSPTGSIHSSDAALVVVLDDLNSRGFDFSEELRTLYNAGFGSVCVTSLLSREEAASLSNLDLSDGLYFHVYFGDLPPSFINGRRRRGVDSDESNNPPEVTPIQLPSFPSLPPGDPWDEPCTYNPPSYVLTMPIVQTRSIVLSSAFDANVTFVRVNLHVLVSPADTAGLYHACEVLPYRNYSVVVTESTLKDSLATLGFYKAIVTFQDKPNNTFDIQLVGRDVYLNRVDAVETLFLRYGDGAIIVDPSYCYYTEDLGEVMRYTPPNLRLFRVMAKRFRSSRNYNSLLELYYPSSNVILLCYFTNQDYLDRLRELRTDFAPLTVAQQRDLLWETFHINASRERVYPSPLVDIYQCCNVVTTAATSIVSTFDCNCRHLPAVEYLEDWTARIAPEAYAVAYQTEQVLDVMLPKTVFKVNRVHTVVLDQRLAYFFVGLPQESASLLALGRVEFHNVLGISPDLENPDESPTCYRIYTTLRSSSFSSVGAFDAVSYLLVPDTNFF